MKNNNLKKVLIYIYPIIVLLIVNIFFFSPQLDNKQLPQDDIVKSIAKTKHISEYRDHYSKKVNWNSAQFSGGPVYLLRLGSKSNHIRHLERLFALYYHGPIIRFFKLSLIMYLALILLGINPWLAVSVSIVYGLNTNFYILFQAGHNSKIATITYFPLILSGLLLTFNKEHLKGMVAIIIGTSLALYFKHIQMTYYFIIILFVFTTILFLISIIQKNTSKIIKGMLFALIAAIIAGLSNFAQLDSSNQFSKNTMRGEKVLKSTNTNSNSKAKKNGLDWDYAMSWSYEVKDVFALLVPRMVGGYSTEKIDKNDPLAKLLRNNGAKVNKDGLISVPGYWSSMMFSAGPAYMGASLILIVFFTLIAFKKPVAISLGLSLIVLILLSLGSHAEFINRFLFDNLPLFNKFRAPSSAITIAPVVLSIIMGLGLNSLTKFENKKSLQRPLFISSGIISVILLFIAFFGSSFFDFLTANDLKYPSNIQDVFIKARISMQKADAFRSLGFVLLTSGVLFLFLNNKIKSLSQLAIALTIIFIIDMHPINNRCISKNDYVSKNKYKNIFNKRKVDNQIYDLEKKGRGFYRVLDMSVNTFNDSHPSYFHNQIGGYDAAKLVRYQDIITHHLSKNNMEVLNMLNTKYFVDQKQNLQINPNANGNAWFVDKIQFVNSPQEEIDALSNFNSKNTAIIYKNDVKLKGAASQDINGAISLTNYEPDLLTYKFNSTSDQLVVFSEVWYGGNPDWVATIDGVVAPILRANYILRAMEIPKGNHEIIFTFRPKARGAIISNIFSLIGLGLLLFFIFISLKNIRKVEVLNN